MIKSKSFLGLGLYLFTIRTQHLITFTSFDIGAGIIYILGLGDIIDAEMDTIRYAKTDIRLATKCLQAAFLERRRALSRYWRCLLSSQLD